MHQLNVSHQLTVLSRPAVVKNTVSALCDMEWFVTSVTSQPSKIHENSSTTCRVISKNSLKIILFCLKLRLTTFQKSNMYVCSLCSLCILQWSEFRQYFWLCIVIHYQHLISCCDSQLTARMNEF